MAARGAVRAPVHAPGRRQWGRWLTGGAALLVMAAVLAWVGAGLIDPQAWPVRTMRIEGELQRVSDDTLRQAVQPHVAAGFWGMSLREIRAAVRSLPWVAEVAVRRVWPDALAVTVREWVPVARWGENGLVTAQGEIYEPQGELPPDLPRLVGPDTQTSEVLTGYRQLTDALQPAGLTVRALTLAPQGGWQAHLSNGMELVLGKTDLEERVQRFLAAVPVLTGGDRSVARVDLRYANGLAVRWAEADTSSVPVGES